MKEKNRINRTSKGVFQSKKPCRYPGCPKLTHDLYCDEHRRKEERRQDRERGNSKERGYRERWRKASKLYLKQHPLCECAECTRQRRRWTANVVHHITPHRGDYNLFWDQDNWLAMSKVCHDNHTLSEMRKQRGKKQYTY